MSIRNSIFVYICSFVGREWWWKTIIDASDVSIVWQSVNFAKFDLPGWNCPGVSGVAKKSPIWLDSTDELWEFGRVRWNLLMKSGYLMMILRIWTSCMLQGESKMTKVEVLVQNRSAGLMAHHVSSLDWSPKLTSKLFLAGKIGEVRRYC